MAEEDSVTVRVSGIKAAIGNLTVMVAIGGYPVYDLSTSHRINNQCGATSCSELFSRLIDVEEQAKRTEAIQRRNQLNVDSIPSLQTQFAQVVSYYQRHKYDRWRYGDQLKWTDKLRQENRGAIEVPRPDPSSPE